MTDLHDEGLARPDEELAEATPTEASAAPDAGTTPPRRRTAWDFALMMLTVALLGSLGVQSFLGAGYVWWATRALPGWESFGQPSYIDLMNRIAAPQLVALVVVMGLCVPKRLLSRRALVVASAAMLALGGAVWLATGDLATGLGLYLAVSGLIQVAVVVLTLAGARGLAFLTEARLAKVGSGLLHLGFILTALVVVALQASPYMLPVFWAATAFTVGGTGLAFYASRGRGA